MKRNFGLDLIRVVAIFFVVSVHFFLNNGFYTLEINRIAFVPALFFRTLFFSCVPLFILLTGYLKCNKSLSKDYYKGIIKIVASYIFISIICILFKKYYLHEQIGWFQSFINIFNFSADKYSWYIEMYFGLFLLIPFLNIIYKNIGEKKYKKILIISLLLITSLSPLINYIKIKGVYINIIPDWWNQIYPLSYYFIGCYINEYKPKINKLLLSVLLTISLIMVTIMLYFYNRGQIFSWDFLGGYNGITTVVISSLIFLLLYDIDIKNRFIIFITKNISLVSLDIYLFSFITDTIIYSKVILPLRVTSYYKYYFIMVILSFISALLLSLIKRFLFYIIKIINKTIYQKSYKLNKNKMLTK